MTFHYPYPIVSAHRLSHTQELAKRRQNLGSILLASSMACLWSMGYGLPGVANPAVIAPTSVSQTSDRPPDPIDSSPRVVNPGSRSMSISTSTYDSYVLGVGDLLHLDLLSVPEYTGEYQVAPDGSLTLPGIAPMGVQGLTLKQVSQLISIRYKRILKRPVVTLRLISPRPIRIGISGAVKRPGAYSIPFVASVVGNPGPGGSTPVRSLSLVTVSSVLQTAGGITQLANVRQIQVRRQNPPVSQELLTQQPELRTSVSPGITTYTVDLWSLLTTGDLSQDLVLRDGDTVIVPEASSVNLTELTTLGRATLSPEKIPVHVVGEVPIPGKVEIPANASLNQAIIAAGGFNIRANRGTVDFIRLNPNGTVTKRKIKVDFSQGINEVNNPPLQENDIIVVDRSGLTRYADTMTTALSPMGNFFNLANILRFFGILNTNSSDTIINIRNQIQR